MKGVESAVGVTPYCTGSSRFSYGGTTVFCVVHGPSDGALKHEDTDKAVLDVRWKDMILTNGRVYDRYFSRVMERILSKSIILELDACKAIQIGLSVVGEARTALFCAVNAALLALVDGGIPLRSMFYASSSFLHEEEVVIFDDGGDMLACHSFGPIEEIDMEKAKELLQYVRETQGYALRAKFSFHAD